MGGWRAVSRTIAWAYRAGGERLPLRPLRIPDHLLYGDLTPEQRAELKALVIASLDSVMQGRMIQPPRSPDEG